MLITVPPARLMRIVLVAALLITTFLATTAVDYPVISGFHDKLQHIFAFFVLAFLTDFSFPTPPWNWRKFIPLLGYGLALEIIQYFIPERFFSLLDLAADATGLLLYLLLLPILLKAIK